MSVCLYIKKGLFSSSTNRKNWQEENQNEVILSSYKKTKAEQEKQTPIQVKTAI